MSDDPSKTVAAYHALRQILDDLDRAPTAVSIPNLREAIDAYVRAIRAERHQIMTAPDKSTNPLHIIVAAMWSEYNKDECCDYKKINRMIEEAADIVGTRIGGTDRLFKLAESYRANAVWDVNRG